MMDDHHLSYAIPYGDLEGFFSGVAQDNTDFSSVVRVHRSRAVENKYPVLGGQTASGANFNVVPFWDVHLKSCMYQSNLARMKDQGF